MQPLGGGCQGEPVNHQGGTKSKRKTIVDRTCSVWGSRFDFAARPASPKTVFQERHDEWFYFQALLANGRWGGCLDVLLDARRTPARASLQFPHDFYSDGATVNYNANFSAGIGQLTATGYTETFSVDGIAPPSGTNYEVDASSTDQADPGAYSITVQVNNTTGLPISGSLTITGVLADFDSFVPESLSGLGNTGTLLNATRSLSISPDSAGDLRLDFSALSGDVVSQYFPGPQAYVQLEKANAPATNWYASSFSSRTEVAYSDTYSYAIPEPCGAATVLLSFFAVYAACCAVRGCGPFAKLALSDLSRECGGTPGARPAKPRSHSGIGSCVLARQPPSVRSA